MPRIFLNTATKQVTEHFKPIEKGAVLDAT